MAITLKAIRPSFGAEVSGIDLSQAMNAETVRTLWDAIDRYSVLVFHDQRLTDVQLRERTGQTLPENVAIDAQGKPTRDAAAARKGAVLTFGGYKGYGLSLSVGLLGALAGASLMSERPHGGFIVAFQPDLLATEDQFRQQATALIGKGKPTLTPRQPADGIQSQHALPDTRFPGQ